MTRPPQIITVRLRCSLLAHCWSAPQTADASDFVLLAIESQGNRQSWASTGGWLGLAPT